MPKKRAVNPHLFRCRQMITGVPGRKIMDDVAVIHDDGIIHEIAPFSELKKEYSGAVTELEEGIIVPGLINPHCHLKLSKLKGKTLSGQGFVPWLLSMMAQDYRETDFDAVEEAVTEIKDQGTCCIGDILTSQDIRIADILVNSGIYHICFCEAFGFLPDDVPGIPWKRTEYGAIAGSGHALYTTDAGLLQEMKTRNNSQGFPFSIHMAEHEDETGMLMGEKTDFYRLLEENNMLGEYSPPMKTPVEYGRTLNLLDKTTLAVHCVQVTDRDIEILAETGTNVCLCPRSNDFIGVGRGPWEKILAAGIRVSLGTDSIASNHDLNLWNELSWFIREIDRDFSMADAVSLITRNPAGALLMDDRLGTLEKGKVWRYAVMPEDVAELFN